VNEHLLALLLVHSTVVNTMGAMVTVVVYEKDLGEVMLFVEEQTAFVSPQTTWRLLIGYPATVVGSVDVQLDVLVTSGGEWYCTYCPKERNASHADINWKPAIPRSASGRSRVIIRKKTTAGISSATTPR